jgi:hypothetical protein
MKNRSFVCALAALSLLLSGCSALSITSTEDGASKPARVGIDDGHSTDTPTAKGPQIPAGMTETDVDLGADCPVAVSLPLGPEWTGETGYDGYQLFGSDTQALITVNCFDEDDDSVQDLIDTAQERMFATSGSAMVSEATGFIDGGQYWSFQGRLAADDMRAVDKQESVMFGIVAGVSVDGRLFKVSVDMLAPADDVHAIDEFEQVLPTVQLDDQELNAPDPR